MIPYFTLGLFALAGFALYVFTEESRRSCNYNQSYSSHSYTRENRSQGSRRERLSGGPPTVHPANNECPICLLSIADKGLVQLDCLHHFHVSCFMEMARRNLNNCPLCRRPI